MTDEPRLEEELDELEEVVEEPVAEEAPAPDDSYLRLAADFDNYRKRVARESAELSRRANERLLNELLPVLDDLERALEAAAEHEEAKLEEGVRLVHRSLLGLVERHGLKEIETVGTLRPAHPRGPAGAARRGRGGGHGAAGAAEGLHARRPGAPAGPSHRG